ncbi:MAG: DMT family transporter [Pseudomonadota bacterium]
MQYSAIFSQLSKAHKGILYAFIGFTAFAFGDVASKWLTADYSFFQVVFINHSIAIIYLLALLQYQVGVKVLARARKLPLHVFRGILNTSVALSVIFSFSILPIADVYTFIFTVPFFSALLGLWFYKQEIGLHRWLAIIVGFIGVVIGMQPGSSGFEPALLVPLLAGFLIALKFTIARSLDGENTLLLGLWPTLISAPIAAALSFYTGFEMINWQDLALHLFAGGCSAVGMVCVSQGFRIAPAAAVSPILYTEMIWALIFGYIIFGDVPTGMMMLGAAIIILSGLYLIEREHRASKEASKSS